MEQIFKLPLRQGSKEDGLRPTVVVDADGNIFCLCTSDLPGAENVIDAINMLAGEKKELKL